MVEKVNNLVQIYRLHLQVLPQMLQMFSGLNVSQEAAVIS